MNSVHDGILCGILYLSCTVCARSIPNTEHTDLGPLGDASLLALLNSMSCPWLRFESRGSTKANLIWQTFPTAATHVKAFSRAAMDSIAHDAALLGRDDIFRGLAIANLMVARTDGLTPAHFAALGGHERCLRALHELGAAASLSAVAKGRTPAHIAAMKGHERCLRALHELGAAASLSAADAGGLTPAHNAAMKGHERCLHALHELGAAASLSAADAEGLTPAHCAVM